MGRQSSVQSLSVKVLRELIDWCESFGGGCLGAIVRIGGVEYALSIAELRSLVVNRKGRSATWSSPNSPQLSYAVGSVNVRRDWDSRLNCPSTLLDAYDVHEAIDELHDYARSLGPDGLDEFLERFGH